MTEFEDNLWQEIVRVHGRELAAVPWAPGDRDRERGRWARPRLLAGTSASVIIAATLAVVLVLSATASSPAYAVTRNADGSVTVRLIRFSGIAGANHTLSRMGVRAKIVAALVMARSAAAAHPCQGKPAGAVRMLTFVPASIPRRQILLLTADRSAHLGYAVPAPNTVVGPLSVARAPVLAPAVGVAPGPNRRRAAAIALQRARIVVRAAARIAALKPAPLQPLPVTRVTVATVAPAGARRIHQISVYCAPAQAPAVSVPAAGK